MRHILTIAGLSLTKNWRDKIFIVFICVALFLTFLINMVYKSTGSPEAVQVKVIVCDLDRSEISGDLIQALKDTGLYQVEHVSKDDIYAAIREGVSQVGYVIPHGFGEGLSTGKTEAVQVISLNTSNLDMAVNKVMEDALTGYLLREAIKGAGSDAAVTLGVEVDDQALGVVLSGMPSEPLFDVEYKSAGAVSAWQDMDNQFKQTAFGMIIMVTMFSIMFNAGDILEEKKDNTWMRLLSTPASKASIVGGKMLGAFSIGAFQVVILLVAGQYLFGIDYGANIGAITILVLAFLFTATGMGLFLAGLVKTTAQLQALVPIVIVVTNMLGGCYWPLEVMPEFMQNIAKFTPQAWVMLGMKTVGVAGESLSTALVPISAILGFGVVFFLLGIYRVPTE